MKIADALVGVSSIFLDTAPVIYYVENNPHYHDLVRDVFDRVDAGSLSAVTSPVTLSECLVAPYRLRLTSLQQDFTDLIVAGRNTTFVPINDDSARAAAELRARYNLTLLDALQVGVALSVGCEAFLTNDSTMRRVSELHVLIVDDLEI
ncbi:MAG: type II toxin-antitoxin system VapC family toxin [Chloroflexota bacterium]|nr:type II toxin-antitoxin system VapC family toxin [Chloroflexota bacterium]MDQ5865680.1 type II toxin-antitoxin system VapC family toxin [Chloroflexota bacterium]